MRRALLTRILIGLIIVALAVLPIGPATMSAHAMSGDPDTSAQTIVQNQIMPCPGCCSGCPPAAMPDGSCMAQCTAPVAIDHGAAIALPTVQAAHVAQNRASRPSFTLAPTPPPPRLAL
jgi:hypothetical protein